MGRVSRIFFSDPPRLSLGTVFNVLTVLFDSYWAQIADDFLFAETLARRWRDGDYRGNENDA